MSPVQIHLMLNHAPILGAIFTALLLGAALLRRSQELLRAGLVALVLVALLAAPVFFSGEPTEKAVDKLPGVTESVIESHEDFAKLAFALLEVLGALALAGLARYRGRAVPRAFGAAVLALTLVESLTLAWTGHLGGQIRHTEIRPDAVAQTAVGND